MKHLWPHLHFQNRISPELITDVPRVQQDAGAEGKPNFQASLSVCCEETCLCYLAMCDYDVIQALLRVIYDSSSIVELWLIKKRQRIDPSGLVQSL